MRLAPREGPIPKVSEIITFEKAVDDKLSKLLGMRLLRTPKYCQYSQFKQPLVRIESNHYLILIKHLYFSMETVVHNNLNTGWYLRDSH